MISFIVAIRSKKMLDMLVEIGNVEIFVPFLCDAHNGIVNIITGKKHDFIKEAIKKSRGEKIVYVGGEVEKNVLEKIIKSNSDIAFVKSKKRCRFWKSFFRMFIPQIRNFEEVLSPLFSVKKDVLNNVDFGNSSNPFPSIISQAEYKNFEVIDADIKNIVCKGNFRYLLYETRRNGELYRLIKFSISGITSVIASEVLLWFLLMIKMNLIVAGLASIEFSILWSFIINDIWTFYDRRKKGIIPFTKRLMKYNGLSLIGLIINAIILIILNKFFGVEPLTANLIGMAVAFIWNFSSNNMWTWLI